MAVSCDGYIAYQDKYRIIVSMPQTARSVRSTALPLSDRVGMTPTEILLRAFFGYDEDTWTGEGKRRDHGSFNPNREWFGFNGYANLISTDYKDYSAFLDDWFISEIDDNRRQVGLPEEVEEWLDAIEEE